MAVSDIPCAEKGLPAIALAARGCLKTCLAGFDELSLSGSVGFAYQLPWASGLRLPASDFLSKIRHCPEAGEPEVGSRRNWRAKPVLLLNRGDISPLTLS